jgi:hypothetical protein
MDEKTTEELIKVVQNANSGNWMPLTIVAGVFGVVIILLVYIWKQKMKEDERRHDSHEKILTQLTENERVAFATLAELKLLTQSNKERLDKIDIS